MSHEQQVPRPATQAAFDAPRVAAPPASRRQRNEAAIVTQAQLDRARPGFERLMALMLIALSTLGTIAALDGGWSRLATFTPSQTAVVGGILLQALCTTLQWLYRRRRWSLPYLLALATSAGPTAVGYWPILTVPLYTLLATLGIGSSLVYYTTVAVVLVIAVLVDYLPEARLID